MADTSRIRLIVEDAGERRACRIGEGTLTVGAGPAAKLRLDAPHVAAIHADIEIHDGRAILRPRPGAMLPVVGGAPVEGPVELQHDLPVEIGGARLTAQYPGGEGPPRAAPVSEAPAGPITSATHQRYRPRGAWQPAAIAIGAVLLTGGTAFWLGTRRPRPAAANTAPASPLETAEGLTARGEHAAALIALAAIPPAELSPELAAEAAALRAEIERRQREVHLRLGDAWKREHLDEFEQDYLLQGTPEPGAIRFYLERLDHFAAHWPEHPEIEWVRRMQQRYAQSASLEQHASLEDLAFEVRFHTAEPDREDWASALRATEDFLDTAPASEHAAAASLRDELLAARAAWFDETLAEARAEDVLGEDGQSVGRLVRIAVYSGDADMADRAAQELVAREDLAGYLRGYRAQSPGEFAALAAEPRIAEYLRSHPLE